MFGVIPASFSALLSQLVRLLLEGYCVGLLKLCL